MLVNQIIIWKTSKKKGVIRLNPRIKQNVRNVITVEKCNIFHKRLI